MIIPNKTAPIVALRNTCNLTLQVTDLLGHIATLYLTSCPFKTYHSAHMRRYLKN